jgi:hypothetical protein
MIEPGRLRRASNVEELAVAALPGGISALFRSALHIRTGDRQVEWSPGSESQSSGKHPFVPTNPTCGVELSASSSGVRRP